MDEEKKFIVPEAEIVDYTNDDIITVSSFEGALRWDGGEWEDW